MAYYSSAEPADFAAGALLRQDTVPSAAPMGEEGEDTAQVLRGGAAIEGLEMKDEAVGESTVDNPAGTLGGGMGDAGVASRPGLAVGQDDYASAVPLPESADPLAAAPQQVVRMSHESIPSDASRMLNEAAAFGFADSIPSAPHPLGPGASSAAGHAAVVPQGQSASPRAVSAAPPYLPGGSFDSERYPLGGPTWSRAFATLGAPTSEHEMLRSRVTQLETELHHALMEIAVRKENETRAVTRAQDFAGRLEQERTEHSAVVTGLRGDVHNLLRELDNSRVQRETLLDRLRIAPPTRPVPVEQIAGELERRVVMAVSERADAMVKIAELQVPPATLYHLPGLAPLQIPGPLHSTRASHCRRTCRRCASCPPVRPRSRAWTAAPTAAG